MSYPLLKKGDKLPAVGVLQKLLNRTGATLKPDGIFGSNTKKAVRDFQTIRGLGQDGVIGINTWPRLVANEINTLQVIDCVDVFDPDLYTMEANDIRNAGGDPITIGGMCNGVEQMVTNILGRARAGRVFLLRFHGHGAAGVAGVSDGHGVSSEEYSSIHNDSMDYILPILRRLSPIFSRYGSVQFMHCQTGRGTSGRQLLLTISNVLGVPATAAIRNQLGGGLTTFKYEGPTKTVLPGGNSLKSWSEGIPNFREMNVP